MVNYLCRKFRIMVFVQKVLVENFLKRIWCCTSNYRYTREKVSEKNSFQVRVGPIKRTETR